MARRLVTASNEHASLRTRAQNVAFVTSRGMLSDELVPIGRDVSPSWPSYHWYWKGAVPLTPIESVAGWSMLILWSAGCDVIEGGITTVSDASLLIRLVSALLMRARNELPSSAAETSGVT